MENRISRLREFFLPHIFVRSINDISFKDLPKIGIDTLIFDKDDTLCLHRQTKIHSSLSTNSLKEAVDTFGKRIYVVSNSRSLFKLEFGPWAEGAFRRISTQNKKPFNASDIGIWLKQEQGYSQDFANVAVIGDRILTDVLLANRLGALSILVTPFPDSKPSPGTRLLMWAEKIFLQAAKAKEVVRDTHNGHSITKALLKTKE